MQEPLLASGFTTAGLVPVVATHDDTDPLGVDSDGGLVSGRPGPAALKAGHWPAGRHCLSLEPRFLPTFPALSASS